MNTKISAVGVAVLTTTMLMFYSGAPPVTSTFDKEPSHTSEKLRAAASPTPNQQRATGDQTDDATEMIRGFLGVSSAQDVNATTLPAMFDTEVECLIATVPDPEHSRLPFLFDVYMDAIQRAAETADFVQDRLKLPWKKTREPIAPALTVEEKKAARDERDLMERVPGIMLFRREKKLPTDRRTLLLLFLVGETPTGGVYKKAMENALQQARRFIPGASPHFRLLGPSFSGSAASISLTVRNWLGKLPREIRPRLTFIGTATAINRQNFVGEMLRDQPNRADIAWHSTVIPDELARQAFYDHLLYKLKTIHLPNASSQEYEVAFLTEGSTAYGNSQRPGKAPPKEFSSDNKIKVLNLTFPLHISRLRTVSWKNGDRRNATNKEPFNFQSSMAPLPLEEEQETTIPLFSSVSASYAEVALATILEEIERQKIRYLGIAATDVRDRLFLAHEIRRHSPNLVLFFLSSELLFLHPEINRELQGSLLVSTYPLAPQNKLWSQSFSQQRKWLQFPVQSAQGVYNATLALLGRADAMQEYETPIFGNATANDRPGLYPTLWLSVVGRDNIWPLATLPIPTSTPLDLYLYARTSTSSIIGSRERLHSEAAYIAFYLFVFVVCLLPTYGVFASQGEALKRGKAYFASRFHAQPQSTPSPVRRRMPPAKRNLPWNWGWMIFGDLVDSNNHNLHLRRNVYLIGCLLAMLCLSLPLWLISAIPFKYPNYRDSFTNIDQGLIWGGFIGAGLMVLFHLVALWILLRDLVVRLTTKQSPLLLLYLTGCLLTILCLTFPVWLLLIQPNQPEASYWGSFTARDRWLILSFAGLTLLIGSYEILHSWRMRRTHPKLKPPSVQQTLLKTLFQRVGGQLFKRTPPNAPPYRKRDFGVLAFFVLGLPLTALLFLGLHFLPAFLQRDKAELILLWERTVGNFSGISPLLPLSLIATGTLTWTLCCLRRLRLLERKPLMSAGRVFTSAQQNIENYYELEFLALETKFFVPGAEPASLESEGIARLEQHLHKMVACSLNQLPGWLWTVITVVTASGMIMGARLMPSVEGRWFNRGITALFMLAYLAIALNFLRFLCIWVALRRLLRRLSWHPLLLGYRNPAADKAPALGRLRLDLSSPLPTFTTLTRSVEQARLLWRLSLTKNSAWATSVNRILIAETEQGLNEALNHDARNEWAEAFAARNQVRAKLIELSKSIAAILRPYWITEAQGGGDHRLNQPEVTTTVLAPRETPLLLVSRPNAISQMQALPTDGIIAQGQEDAAVLEQGERFLIYRLIGFLQYVLAQMQNLVVFVTIGVLLMLGAVLSYPFQPMSPLLIFNWVTIISVVSITMLIFVQMNRNPTLSLLSGTTPGELDWNSQFILQITVHGLLPLLAITGVQFSDSLREMMTWLGISSQAGGH